MWLQKTIGVIYSFGASTVTSLATFKQNGQKILSRQHFLKDQQFDLDLCPCDLKNNRDHLLARGIHCTKFGNFQGYWVDNIFSERGSLTLTSDHVISKSVEDIYFLGAFLVPRLATLKQRGQKILSGHCLVYRMTNRQVKNKTPPIFKGGHIKGNNWRNPRVKVSFQCDLQMNVKGTFLRRLIVKSRPSIKGTC